MLLTIVSFLFTLSLVVVIHEFGHFFVAKRSGMKVTEFAIGFGPRLFSKPFGETLFSINALPLGGFVNIAGLGDDNVLKKENDSPQETVPYELTFNSKPLKNRIGTVVAGPFMNMILASFIFFFLFLLVGVPSKLSNEIETILPGSLAEQAGLKTGDQLLAINGQPVTAMEKAIETIHHSAGKKLTLEWKRGEEQFSIDIIPKLDPKRKIGLIGFSAKVHLEKQNPATALYFSIIKTGETVLVMFDMLGQLFSGRASVADLAGPVGIAQITGQVATQGWVSLLSLTAFLSINLGVINLLPIPALDGGRLLFLVIEAVRGKPIDPKKEGLVHTVGLVLLLALMLFLTLNDLRRMFHI